MKRNRNRIGLSRPPIRAGGRPKRRQTPHGATPRQLKIAEMLLSELQREHPEWHDELQRRGRLARFIAFHVRRISARFGYGDPSSEAETTTDLEMLLVDVGVYLTSDPLFDYQRRVNCPRQMKGALSAERDAGIADLVRTWFDSPGKAGKTFYPVQGYSIEWDDVGLRINAIDYHATELLIPWHRLAAMAGCARGKTPHQRTATNPAVDAREDGPVAGSRRLWKSISSLRESRIVREIAEDACRRVRRRAIARLQRMTDLLLSSGEPETHTVWDGICVENQTGRSRLWGAYDRAVRSAVAEHVSELHGFERRAIWLQTPEGQCHTLGAGDDRDQPRDVAGAIVDYIAQYFVHFEAYRWFNPRIHSFVERRLRA